MSELLGRDKWQVVRVLEALADDDALQAAVETSQKQLAWLIASFPNLQVKRDGPVVAALADAIKSGALDALVIQTAMNGCTPWRSGYDGASALAIDGRKANIPCFRVPEARYPQRYGEGLMGMDIAPEYSERAYLDELGVVHLQNAFSEDAARVVRVIHGALNADPDPLVVRSAVHAYFEQTHWPPQGWAEQPSQLVRTV